MVQALGYVLITVEPGKEADFFTGLGQYKKTGEQDKVYVEEAHTIFGEYDFIAKVIANRVQNLGDFIVDKIRAIPGVANTRTLLGFILEENKDDLPDLSFLDQ